MKQLHWALFLTYCGYILWITLLCRKPSGTREVQMALLWSYREWLSGNPNGVQYVRQNLSNILFFVPFGFLVPAKTWKSALLISAAFTVFIEASQFAFRLGLCELDDMLCNVLGAAIGFLFYKLILKWRRK